MTIEGSRRKPTSVMPNSSAKSAASDEGADTAHNIGTPAMAAFWTSSNDADPRRGVSSRASGNFSSRNAQPMTLSTALWRPTSSRNASKLPSRSKSPRRVKPARLLEDLLGFAQPGGKCGEERRRDLERVVVHVELRARSRPRRSTPCHRVHTSWS